MAGELTFPAVTAITISFLHTVTGPDHYLPFIALSKSRSWTVRQTLLWTLVCGIGHVGSSVALGLGGVALGWSLTRISWLEGVRGGLAGWAMLVAGTGYLIYAILQLRKNKWHKHFELDGDEMYVFEHRHGSAVMPQQKRMVTPWIMFIVFVLGPCEPLIPLLSFPAAQQSFEGVSLLIGLFTFFTLLTMVTMVMLGYYGISFLNSARLERYAHVLAGSTVLLCGGGMLWLGW